MPTPKPPEKKPPVKEAKAPEPPKKPETHFNPNELAKLLKDDRDISILVLASSAGKEGPGPLVAMFAGAVQAIPVTIVPGTFTDAQIDALA